VSQLRSRYSIADLQEEDKKILDEFEFIEQAMDDLRKLIEEREVDDDEVLEVSLLRLIRPADFAVRGATVQSVGLCSPRYSSRRPCFEMCVSLLSDEEKTSPKV